MSFLYSVCAIKEDWRDIVLAQALISYVKSSKILRGHCSVVDYFYLCVLMLYISVSNFSVMSGHFLG